MIVVVAGLPRSGTTWIYNVVLEILGHSRANQKAFFAEKLDHQTTQIILKYSRETETLVIKTHDHFRLSSLAAKLDRSSLIILLPIRNYWGLARSRSRIFGAASASSLDKEMAQLKDALYEIPAPFHIFSDAMMFCFPTRIVSKIAETLGVPLTGKQKRRASHDLRPGNIRRVLAENASGKGFDEWFDEQTHFHADHIDQPNPIMERIFLCRKLFDDDVRNYGRQVRSLKRLRKRDKGGPGENHLSHRRAKNWDYFSPKDAV